MFGRLESGLWTWYTCRRDCIYWVWIKALFPGRPFLSCNLTYYLLLLHWYQICNEKAKLHLSNMRKKPPFPFQQKFPHVDPMAVRLLKRLLEFDPKDRLTAQEVRMYLLKLLIKLYIGSCLSISFIFYLLYIMDFHISSIGFGTSILQGSSKYRARAFLTASC